MKKTLTFKIENNFRTLIVSASSERFTISILDESSESLSYDFTVEEADELTAFINKNVVFPASMGV